MGTFQTSNQNQQGGRGVYGHADLLEITRIGFARLVGKPLNEPVICGFVSWVLYATLLNLLLFLVSRRVTSRQQIEPISEFLPTLSGALVSTSPFLAGYFLRGRGGRMSGMGLLLIVLFFVALYAFSPRIDKSGRPGDGLWGFPFLLIFAFVFAILMSFFVGAVTGNVIRRSLCVRTAASR